MKRLIVAALAAWSVGGPAWASDARLVSHRYNPDEVVQIQGRAGVQASITFGKDESIENVALGDSSSWQVTPNKRANLLFVKPLTPRARTNMTVVTDRRTYFFDLVAGLGAAPLYVLRFTYADELSQGPETRHAAVGQSAQAARASNAVALDGAALNFAWRTRGKAKLLPARIYDNGDSTFISWPKDAPIPAILIRNENGDEGPVNFTVRDDVVVVHSVPRLLVLRSGKDSATLERSAVPHRPAKSALAAASNAPGE